MIQFCFNCSSHYINIVLSQAASNFSNIGPSVLFSLIIGLGESYKIVQAAQGAAERRTKVANLTIFLLASGTSVTT
jgi:hypothetical protein